MKPTLLFLCHRIPFPPNKGDKIRSFHLLKYLASRYRVFLGAFVDDPSDWQHENRLKEWCEMVSLFPLKPRMAKLKSLKGLLTGEPLTLPYYHDSEVQRWVHKTVDEYGINQMVVYSSSMAQYLLAPEFDNSRRVIDFVDVDSDKWRQYAVRKTWPMNWVYHREAQTLHGFERRIASLFDQSLLVSREEAEMFKRLYPECSDRISFYSNGVDVEVFSPDTALSSPFEGNCRDIVFTGAMDYWPNEDAVVWFTEEVFPVLMKDWPDARFHIVGGNPTDKVKNLAKVDGVCVTGRVHSVQPYLQYAAAVVAPMRIARGIQNKVLEAMSMAKPVVVTSQGLEGINAVQDKEVLLANDTGEFVTQLSLVFRGGSLDVAEAAREKILNEYSWASTLPVLDKWLPGADMKDPDE
ncbi:MAG: TIGR03087 family PEP-CTERM/XrtA system glycosyltransferase [Gammaproteobacteria bacterium]|nr:TIGR03087 family PEP-CTERM/XrtA system glycosyltransferase [Gammaproteobacteria bacterium]